MNIDGENQKIDKQKILYQNNQLAGEGFRVIGVAKLNENSLEIKKEYNENDIKGLTFLGLVGFIDPIREDVEEAVQMCENAGIKTIMITGDQKNTAETLPE